MPTRGHRLPLSGKQMGGGEGEGGKSERRKTSVTMIIGWWREIERVKAWCRGSPELSSGVVLYWKESQDPEKLLYTRLWFITAKGYRLRSAKDKGDPAQSFQSVSSVGSRRWHSILSATSDDLDEVLPARDAHLASVSRDTIRAAGHTGLGHPHD